MIDINKIGISLWGIPVMQSWSDVMAWSSFYADHTEIKLIIELGTGSGGFSLFLSNFASLFTVDKPARAYSEHPAVCSLVMCRGWRGDVMDEAIHADIKVALRRDMPVLLFCDNGNKRAEVAAYAGYLKTGDYLVVHDWRVEISSADIPGGFLDITPLEFNDCNTRFFVRC